MTRNIKLILSILLFSLIGYLYYAFWGCQSGCRLKGDPSTMTFYGGLVGLVIGFPSKSKKIKN
jgi:hypothetical protein